MLYFFNLELSENIKEDHLVKASGKAFSEMQIRSPMPSLLNKTKSENALDNDNLDREEIKSNKSINLYRKLNGSTHDLSTTSLNSENHYLSSSVGLFGGKESTNQTPESSGGILRRLRSRTQEFADAQVGKKQSSLYGLKADMKSNMKLYGTMEKLDVSDWIENECLDNGDEYQQTITFEPDEPDRMVSPDIFDDEDLEDFANYFKGNKGNNMMMKEKVMRSISSNSSQNSKSMIQAARGRRRDVYSVTSETDTFNDNYLTNTKDQLRREYSTASTGKALNCW